MKARERAAAAVEISAEELLAAAECIEQHGKDPGGRIAGWLRMESERRRTLQQIRQAAQATNSRVSKREITK